MKSTKKRALRLLTLLLCVMLLAGCNTPNAPTNSQDDSIKDSSTVKQYSFTIGTSASGGAVYGVGAGLSQLLNEKISGLSTRAISTGGAVDNVGLMERGEIQLACNASNTNAMAYNGELTGIAAQKNLRGIVSLYPSVFHLVATKSSGIESIADFAGTRGAVGQSASASDVYTQHIVEGAGLNYKDRKDFEPVYADPSDAAEQLKDGHIDWGHLPLGVPGSAVIDLAMSGAINIIPIEGEYRDKLIQNHPYYVPYTIPGGTYSGFDEDIETAACVITFVADESVDEEIVYEMTKTIWENLDEVQQIAASLSWMDRDDPCAGIGVPLHPGAERYYKEIGVIS